MRYKRDLKGSSQGIGAEELNGTIADIARCNRKSKIQDGGRQTENTHISVSGLNRNEFSTAARRFLRLMNSKAPLRILHNITRSRKLKMAVVEPEIVIYRLPVEM